MDKKYKQCSLINAKIITGKRGIKHVVLLDLDQLGVCVCVCVHLSKAMLRVLRCVETMGEVSLCAVFSCDGSMAARRDGASRGDRDSGSVYTTCFS